MNEVSVRVPLRFVETGAAACINRFCARVVACIPLAWCFLWELGTCPKQNYLAGLLGVAGEKQNARAHQRIALKVPPSGPWKDEPSLAAPLAVAVLANEWARFRLTSRLRRSHIARRNDDMTSD